MKKSAKSTRKTAKPPDMYRAPLVYEVPDMEAAEVRRDVTYKTADGTDLKMDIFVPPGLKPDTRLGQKGVTFPPIFIGRAGLDAPWINETIDRFAARALAANATIEVMNHAVGRHGFDILDDDARSKEIIARAVEFIKAHI